MKIHCTILTKYGEKTIHTPCTLVTISLAEELNGECALLYGIQLCWIRRSFPQRCYR